MIVIIFLFIIFILLIFFFTAYYFSKGELPDLNRKTTFVKNTKTGYYEEKKIDEKGNIIHEKKEIELKKNNKEIELKKNNNEIIDSNKQDLIIAKIIKKEIDSQKYNEVTWLKAFKKAKGNQQEAKALYAEYREHQLEEEYYQKNNPEKNSYTKVNFKKIRSESENSFFEKSNFLSGREDLKTAFWLYVFAGNFFVGLIAGFLSVIISSFMLVFLLGYLFFSTVGLWKCADTYTLKKQKRSEPYGWAIGAKIYVVINLLYLPVQIFHFIGNK